MKMPLEPWRSAEPDIGEFHFEPVNRDRLARYLEVPSASELDEVTQAEIDKLDAHRNELLALWARAVALPIDRMDEPWIELEGGVRIQSIASYTRQLKRSGADWLIVTAFTVGETVDARVRQHFAQDELLEAFVLQQWAATMAEQARARLTLALCGWADHLGRSLIPYSGPGYNGWPLGEIKPLLGLLGNTDDARSTPPLRSTESGMLVPLNSMVIVFGATPRRVPLTRQESVAQCRRCAMRNCRYRVAAVDAQAEPQIVGLAG